MKVRNLGKKAYEEYSSLIAVYTHKKTEPWEKLAPMEREAWGNTAQTILDLVKEDARKALTKILE